jgi:hypothetical protein
MALVDRLYGRGIGFGINDANGPINAHRVISQAAYQAR